MHGLHSAAALLRELGHEVVEDSPALPAADSLEIFLQVFGPEIALGIGLGERLNGRPPEEDEIHRLLKADREAAGAADPGADRAAGVRWRQDDRR